MCLRDWRLLAQPFHFLFNSTILRLSALVTLALFFVPSCFRTLAAFAAVVRSVSICPFRTGMPVSQKYPGPCNLVFLRSTGPPSYPQLLSTRSIRPVFFDVPLSPSSRIHTLPLLGAGINDGLSDSMDFLGFDGLYRL